VTYVAQLEDAVASQPEIIGRRRKVAMSRPRRWGTQEKVMSNLASWGVLLKCETPSASPAPRVEELDTLIGALPGRLGDKLLTGGGRDFTAWFWVSAANASQATRLGARLIRSAASDAGMPPIRVIRSHSASTNGRISPFPGTRDRRDRADVWSVLYRAQGPRGQGPIDDAALNRFRTQLGEPDSLVTFHGDKEKFLVSDGTSFTARFWASGAEPWAALRGGRNRVIKALESSGLAGWTIVRAQVATPAARDGDTFPGANGRHLEADEETR
jgi:hypothetical protein